MEVIISYFLALAVGIVVSLDVAGLLISQHKDFSGSNILPRAIKVSLLHAGTHSILFLAYFYIVLWAIEFPPEFITWLQETFSDIFPKIILSELLKTVALLSSIIILIFVWITYANKIAEAHNLKFSTTDNHATSLRIDVRLVFQAVKFFYGLVKGHKNLKPLLNFVIALAVAVDMLAITSLIRVFFTIVPDAANLTGETRDELPHFDFGCGADLDPIIFSGLIFVAVFICSGIAILISRSVTDSRNNWLKSMRILEPFLVFWILVLALDHLFGNSLVEATDYWHKFYTSGLVALLLTFFLICVCGWKEILDNINKGSDVSIESVENINNAVDDLSFYWDLAKKFLIIVIALFLMVIVFFISHRPEVITEGKGLEGFLKVLSYTCAFMSLFTLFLPCKGLAEREFRFAKSMRNDNQSINHTGNRAIFFSLLAYFVLVIYIQFSFPAALFHRVHFITPLLYTGLIVTLTWLLLIVRRVRFSSYTGNQPKRIERRMFYSTTKGDIYTAFALVIFCWQVIQYFFAE